MYQSHAMTALPAGARGPQGTARHGTATVPCRACALCRRGFCSALSMDQVTRLLAPRATLDLPRGREITLGDRTAPQAGVLAEGYLRIVNYGRDGGRQVIGIRAPGDLISGWTRRSDTIVLESSTPARICRFATEEYHRLLQEDVAFRRLVYAQIQREVERLRYFSWSLGALSPRERFATFLVLSRHVMPWQAQTATSGVLTIDLPRPDIADLLGTTVESISRISRALAREGLIRIRDPRHFEVPDLALLARAGGISDIDEELAMFSREPATQAPRSPSDGDPEH